MFGKWCFGNWCINTRLSFWIALYYGVYFQKCSSYFESLMGKITSINMMNLNRRMSYMSASSQPPHHHHLITGLYLCVFMLILASTCFQHDHAPLPLSPSLSVFPPCPHPYPQLHLWQKALKWVFTLEVCMLSLSACGSCAITEFYPLST